MSNSINIFGLCLVSALMLQFACADIETNEVNDNSTPEYMIQGVRVYPNDRHCALVGGLCVHTSDCNLPTTNKGLCPSSAHLGVECCYELPVRPAPCEQHLGACMKSCNPSIQRPATDCDNGEVCCVLMNK
ncbi:U-scoloptoxin(19)-Sm1a-like isoform X1 [Drosophila hydei]|uniref:U-scoloptoxin(19)-Sm1a-like isoform X1 n=1 Tax=Drosophila hydei TaxID=7224 RepID=A0A6J1L8K6_DROHY|nr:U-scoloptoxin(19)-Sm1a-like isoform X1 [Drosophila hydei]